MKAGFDITVIINFHREARLAQATIASVLAAIASAERHNLVVELLCILDNSDSLTKLIVGRLAIKARILTVSFGNLAASRNFAAESSSGRYLAFIDGDDLWGSEWLCAAYSLACNFAGEQVIIHPKLNVYFGRGLVPYCQVHPDMRYEKINVFDIAVANRWTALSFALRDTYCKHKYHRSIPQEGFGYEDWSWNYNTIRSGFRHITAEQGVHFIRKKRFGSMSEEANLRLALPQFAEMTSNQNDGK